MSINCYYDIFYNNKFRKFKIKIVVKSELKKTIYKYNRWINIPNKKRLYMEGLNILFRTLDKIIPLSDNVVIHTDSFEKIPILSKYEIFNCNNLKEIENLKLRYAFHENWKFNINFKTNQVLKKELYTEKHSKNHMINKKIVKHSKPKVIRRINDLIKNECTNIVFFDIEMNCNDDKKIKEISESISIGAVKVFDDGEISSDKFYSLIKPAKQSILSDKCKEITRLSQDDIDSAVGFKEVMINFSRWVGDKPTIFASWGREDIKVLKRDDKYNGFKLPIISRMRKKYIEFQKEFCHYYVNSKDMTSLIRALEMFNFNFEGTQHNALDDTINLVKIYKASSKK
jgi:inhibitor of KinA sporulation pathway (predicted exonuclease)